MENSEFVKFTETVGVVLIVPRKSIIKIECENACSAIFYEDRKSNGKSICTLAFVCETLEEIEKILNKKEQE